MQKASCMNKKHYQLETMVGFGGEILWILVFHTLLKGKELVSMTK